MSLRLKIILSFTLCIILSFSPLLYFMNTQAKDINMQQFEHQSVQLIYSKSNEIGSWLNQRISEIRIMLDFPPIKNLDMDEIKPYVACLNSSKHLQDRSSNETFAIGSTNGLGYISENFFIDISERKYFNKVMKSKDMEYIISDPVISHSDKMPIFLICYPIVKDGEKIGFINGSVSLDKVAKTAHEIDIYNGYSWVMNTDLDVYSTEKYELTDKFISKENLELVVKDFKYKKLGFSKLKNIDGEDSTVFFSSVPHADDWILCTMIEDAEIYKQSNTIIDMILKRGVAFLFFATILAILVSGSIVRPIRKLKHNMTEVSNGNLNSYYSGHSKDEISILGQHFNQMLDDIKALIDKVYKMESQKRNAELKTLQSQINPHFLYNTLDTVQWKALEYDDFEVADMISSLSGFFRISLSDGKEFITLEDEAKHVGYYLDIQKVRYKEKVNYTINIEEDVKQFLIPKLIVQPLVENSIYHGLKLVKRNGDIKIDIFRKNDFIFIKVADNGLGIDEDKLVEIKSNLENSIESEHYGLYNINERLKIFFGNKYKIYIKSKYDLGTTILLKIPIISEGFQCLE